MRTRFLPTGTLLALALGAAAQQAPVAGSSLAMVPVPAAAPAPALHLPQGQHVAFNRYATGLPAPGLPAPSIGLMPTKAGLTYRPVAPALNLAADVLASALLPYNYSPYRTYQTPVLAPAPTAFRLGTQP